MNKKEITHPVKILVPEKPQDPIQDLMPQKCNDTLEVRINKDGIKIAKSSQENGNHKRSITQYPNGTIHLTETIKPT